MSLCCYIFPKKYQLRKILFRFRLLFYLDPLNLNQIKAFVQIFVPFSLIFSFALIF